MARKTVTKKAKKTQENTDKPYFLSMDYNNETFTCETDDLYNSILSFKPEELLTDLYISVKTKENTIQRYFSRQQGKNLFLKEDNLPILINNLTII